MTLPRNALLGPLLGESLTLVTLVRFLGSALVLVVPTALMGATLPLIVRSSLTPSEGLGPRLGLLYGINTAGAVIGTLAAGFWLIPALGIRQSFLVAACLALLVGIAALAAARYDKGREEPAIANHVSFGPTMTGSHLVLAVFDHLWLRVAGSRSDLVSRAGHLHAAHDLWVHDHAGDDRSPVLRPAAV